MLIYLQDVRLSKYTFENYFFRWTINIFFEQILFFLWQQTDEERREEEEDFARRKRRREELKEQFEAQKRKPLFPTATEEQLIELRERGRDKLVITSLCSLFKC